MHASLSLTCSTRIQHNSQSVFITEEDVSIMRNFDGCDGAAIAELLATDEVLCPVLLHKIRIARQAHPHTGGR